MLHKNYRIGICGAAGSGKSTLAQKISSLVKVPLLRSREITHEILIRDGYDFGGDVQVERFLSSENRQKEILEKTINQHNQVDSFVSDRTFVDLAAYAISEMDSDADEISAFVRACKGETGRYSHLFVTPWFEETEIEDNAVRTLDPWYQYQIRAICLSVVRDWDVKVCELKHKTLEENMLQATEYLDKA